MARRRSAPRDVACAGAGAVAAAALAILLLAGLPSGTAAAQANATQDTAAVQPPTAAAPAAPAAAAAAAPAPAAAVQDDEPPSPKSSAPLRISSPTRQERSDLGWLVVYAPAAVAAARAAGRPSAVEALEAPAATPDEAPELAALGRFYRPPKADALLKSMGAAPLRSLTAAGDLAIDVVASARVARALRGKTGGEVAWVERETRVKAHQTNGLGSQSVPLFWALDRIDQRREPLDGAYFYYTSAAGSGLGVDVYVLDTGLRTTHSEFGGRATNVQAYYKPGVTPSNDGFGHGTHVAGLIGGANAGVAKKVSIFGVKVLSNKGGGTNGKVISAINYVVNQAQVSGRPTIINMSLGGPYSKAMNAAVENAAAKGIIIVVSAGNDNSDSAKQSPASAPGAVTVAASDEADGRAYFSNYGAGVDIFAPGSAIRSASALSDSGFRTLSGTSMAAPLVSGVAASLWSACPSCSKDDILKQLLDTYATEGVLTGIPAGTPNKLVFSRFA